MRRALSRADRLDNAALDYAPDSELGVIFLFAHIAKRRYGLRVERIRSGFPDCIGYRGGERIRIEFEYRSRNFRTHGHDPKACDWIVCWIHDWPACPSTIRVVELRKEFGKGFNVWVVPIAGVWRDRISTVQGNQTWTAPSQASEGDLVLFYKTKPQGLIKDVFRLSSPVRFTAAGFRPGKEWMASIKRVATLKAPIYLEELRAHPILRTAGFVRGGMRTRFRLTPHWPDLYRFILDRNPGLGRTLSAYGPARLT